MKRILLLAFIFALVIPFSACGSQQQQQQSADAATKDEPTQSMQIGIDKGDTFTIKAGGLELKYPAKWKDKVTVKADENQAAFTRGDDKIFDILFQSDKGTLLGTVKGEKNTVISVVDYKADPKDEELMEMQSDLNVIISHLSEDYDFAVGEKIRAEESGTFEIETPVVTLQYPSKWKDKVTVDITNDGVMFSNSGDKLFDLMFVEGNGYLLGKYDDTPIYVVDYKVKTDEQRDMLSGINVILEHLREDSHFKEAE